MSTNTDIDVLVNNAGHMSIGIAEAFTEEQIHQQFEVNFFGPVRLSRAILPRMRERGTGLIVHVSSIVGRLLFPACAFYCASKFALEAYAEVLHYELTGLGIDSVLVEPGPFPTQLLSNSPGPFDGDHANGYGQLAGVRDLFIGNFPNFFASVAPIRKKCGCHLKLISMPSGQRPLRTVCGPDYGATQLNRLSAPIQAQVLREHCDGDARSSGSSGTGRSAPNDLGRADHRFLVALQLMSQYPSLDFQAISNMREYRAVTYFALGRASEDSVDFVERTDFELRLDLPHGYKSENVNQIGGIIVHRRLLWTSA